MVGRGARSSSGTQGRQARCSTGSRSAPIAPFGSTVGHGIGRQMQVIGGQAVPKRYVFARRTRPMTYIETRDQISALIARVVAARSVRRERPGRAQGQRPGRDRRCWLDRVQGLIAIDPEGGKVARAAAMSPAIESGCVYVLEGAEWVEPYITEIVAFPFARPRRPRGRPVTDHAPLPRRPRRDAPGSEKRRAAFAAARLTSRSVARDRAVATEPSACRRPTARRRRRADA
jgi:predicted phage terminase large subunit-like protein